MLRLKLAESGINVKGFFFLRSQFNQWQQYFCAKSLRPTYSWHNASYKTWYVAESASPFLHFPNIAFAFSERSWYRWVFNSKSDRSSSLTFSRRPSFFQSLPICLATPCMSSSDTWPSLTVNHQMPSKCTDITQIPSKTDSTKHDIEW